MGRTRKRAETAIPLAAVGAFAGLSESALAFIERTAQNRRFATGQMLLRQGDPSDCMHVILSGRVTLERTHPHMLERVTLAELGPGEVVGEMGLLDGEPRSATVVAIAPTETIELDAVLLNDILRQYPQVSSKLLRILSQRLRSTNELAEYYLERTQN